MLTLDGIWEFAWTAQADEKAQYDSFASVPGCFDANGLHFLDRGYAYYRRTVHAGGNLRLRIGSFGPRGPKSSSRII